MAAPTRTDCPVRYRATLQEASVWPDRRLLYNGHPEGQIIQSLRTQKGCQPFRAQVNRNDVFTVPRRGRRVISEPGGPEEAEGAVDKDLVTAHRGIRAGLVLPELGLALSLLQAFLPGQQWPPLGAGAVRSLPAQALARCFPLRRNDPAVPRAHLNPRAGS
jgi:hypothetical protein